MGRDAKRFDFPCIILMSDSSVQPVGISRYGDKSVRKSELVALQGEEGSLIFRQAGASQSLAAVEAAALQLFRWFLLTSCSTSSTSNCLLSPTQIKANQSRTSQMGSCSQTMFVGVDSLQACLWVPTESWVRDTGHRSDAFDSRPSDVMSRLRYDLQTTSGIALHQSVK